MAVSSGEGKGGNNYSLSMANFMTRRDHLNKKKNSQNTILKGKLQRRHLYNGTNEKT